jgi:PAS domain S-box-containing protein
MGAARLFSFGEVKGATAHFFVRQGAGKGHCMSGRLTCIQGHHWETDVAASACPVCAGASIPSAPSPESLAGLLPAILDSMGDGLIVADENGRFILFNAAARRILGEGPADLPLKDWPQHYGLCRPGDGSLVDPRDLSLARALRGEETDQIEMLIRNPHIPGGVLVSITGRPLRDSQGIPRGGVIVLRDVTARMHAEDELRRSRERFALAVEGSRDGLWDWDVTRAEVYFSPRWKAMLGYEDHEISNRFEEWSSRLHSEDRQRALQTIDDYFNGLLTEYSLEHRLCHKDGSYRWILARGVAVRDAAGKISRMAGSHADVTARREEEEELRRAKVAAEQANRAKSEFLANVSHELRTPVNGILVPTELMLGAPLLPEQHDHLKDVESSAHALLAVIDDLLAFASMETGKLQLAPREFALRTSLDNTLKRLTTRALAKGLKLAWRVDAGVPDRLIGDWPRLGQVVGHLVGNAVKFTENGMVVVTINRRNGGQEEKAIVHVEVMDTGIGVPLEKQQVIFEPFVQADGSMRRHYGGAGLGLAISARLIEAMSGRLWVESVAGRGSVFQFDVPLTVVSGAVASAGSNGMPLDARSRLPRLSRPLRLLIAEDNPLNQRMSVALIQKLGCSAAVAADGAEALSALRLEPFDAVLMDVQMPGMDGLETTVRIRAEEAGTGRRLPIIALTAHAMKGDRERCLEAGMDAYLSKPVSFRDLYLVLADLADRTKSQPAAASAEETSRIMSEPTPPSSVFNRQVALTRVGGDEELLRELTEVFLADCPKWLNDLRKAAASGNAVDLRRAAHTIKGAVGYFGADEAGAAADRLQELGRAGDVAAAVAVVPELEHALERLTAALRAAGPSPSLENLP